MQMQKTFTEIHGKAVTLAYQSFTTVGDTYAFQVYNVTETGEGWLRIYDTATNKSVSLKKFPTYYEAINAYNKSMEEW